MSFYANGPVFRFTIAPKLLRTTAVQSRHCSRLSNEQWPPSTHANCQPRSILDSVGLQRGASRLVDAPDSGCDGCFWTPTGNRKLVLGEDEYKNLQTDRVTYTLGPEQEVQVVREI